MKLKRCFKTVLSSVLAAAMLITAVPSNLTLDVQAAPVVEEVTTEEATVAVEEVAATETVTEETTTETVVEEKEENVVPETVADNSAIDTSTGYWGPTIGEDGSVTIYYYGAGTETVQIKGAYDGWASLKDLILTDTENGIFSITMPFADTSSSFDYGFMVNDNWANDDKNPGSGNSWVYRNPVVDADSNVTLYYYPAHGEYPTSVKVKYKVSGADAYTEVEMNKATIYSVTLSGLEDGTYEYVFDVDGTEVADTNNASGKGEFSVVSYPEADPNVKSPVVSGNEVTFNYYGPTASEVFLAGSMNGWDKTADPMTYNEDTAYWSITKTLAAGSYSYKFVVDGSWPTDPLNTSYDSEGNSKVAVAGLASGTAEVVRGQSVELDATLKCYDAEGTATDAAVTYALADADATWASEVTLSTDDEGVTTLATTLDLPAEVTEFALTATDATGNTSTVTVSVVDKVYNYTIYYYDPDHAMDTAALWVWQTNGAGATAPTYFTAEEVLADGNTWMKAEVTASYPDISIIPRAYADWEWQDTTRSYVMEDDSESVTLYIVKDDGSKIYTELPEIKVAEKRYLVVEYTRTSSTPENWYFYTWNSGYGANVFVPFEEVNGKWIAAIPVKQGLSTISYCIERATVDGETVTHWAEKDGNDYNCDVPVDQTVVKIRMEEGKGITHTYPYNTGYEIDVENKAIHFYYRDDAAFLAGSESGYASAQIEIDGIAYDMTWDAEAQRYVYDMEDLKPGDYKYRYVLKETAESEAEYVLDKYNENTVTEEGVDYSVCTYDLFKVKVTAKMNKAAMDYNDNNVLSVKFAGKNGADVSGLEVASATADLSALGGSSEAQIDPALMELSISVKEGIAAGNKKIPVTVIDQFGNKYTANTTVKVNNRNKGDDFDWDEAVIYFTVTDRFYDGNSSNNNPGYDISENGGSSYHGGDFAGLTAKLDYLDDLGVNTIWITPIVENEMAEGLATTEGLASWGYHGYWASDFEKLDSHLGTEEEFKTLLDEAHARGMKIMVDVVLNHAGYNNEEYFNSILKDEEGNYIRMIREGDEIVIGDDQKNPLSDLPDFLTENDEVRNLLVEWQSNWISKYDIDYYRVDTVKHVDDTTWSAFKNALTKIDPDFKMIGEWAGAGYATDTGMLNEGRMDSLLDFDFNGEATDFVRGDVEGTENFMNARNAAIDNTATLGAFIGSHDEPGFAYALMNPESGVAMSADDAMAATKVAASLQITAKGQTVIYYGEEIGMTGANNYPYQDNRYDFDWSAVSEDNDMLAHYKKMLDIREEYSEVFAKGTRTTIAASNDGGYDVFAKSYGGTTIYTALNVKNQATEYTFTGMKPGVCMVNLYNDEFVYADKDGNMTVTIPAAVDGGTAVLVESATYNPFSVQAVATKVYTGKNITLTTEGENAELKVFYGKEALEAGTDYKVTYKNNKKAGTATVIVEGKGNFTGKETITFEILKKNVSDNDIVVTYQRNMIVNNKKLNPLTWVTYSGKKLSAKTDYTVSFEKVVTVSENNVEITPVNAVKEAGTYNMVITGKNNFTGVEVVPFTVHEKQDNYYMKDMKILVEGVKDYSTAYTGAAIEPKVSVTRKDGVSVSDNCYTVDYDETTNANVGKSVITIKGNPEAGYFGTVTKTFKITGTPLKDVAKIDLTNWKDNVDAKHVGEGTWLALQENVILVTKDGSDTPLTYTVSYIKADRPGQATMVFEGTGAYTGKITKKYTVNKMTLTEDMVTTASGNAIHAKKGAEIDVTVSVNGIVLEEGKDYTVKFSANKNVTDGETAKATIKGAGLFKGQVIEYFAIDPADLADVTVTAADAVYKNKAGKFAVVPTVKDADGKALKNNKDFTCSYYLVTVSGNDTIETPLDVTKDIVDAGSTVKVVINAKSANYVGTNDATYEVQTSSIAGAKVKVAAQVYTGQAITITEEDITSIKVGKEKLVLGEHYVIVEDSYVNNVDKGTASVTLEGIGNYGGTKTVTFKITSRTVAWWWNLLH